MADGTVVLIGIAGGQPGDGKAPETVDQATAVAGQGLEGDRYFDTDFDSQVTLIEAEAIDGMVRDAGLTIAYEEARRNIVTRGVELTGLVDKEFRVGDVRMRGVRLCEPCKVSFPDADVKNALVSRGGLRADILSDGVISTGDSVHVP